MRVSDNDNYCIIENEWYFVFVFFFIEKTEWKKKQVYVNRRRRSRSYSIARNTTSTRAVRYGVECDLYYSKRIPRRRRRTYAACVRRANNCDSDNYYNYYYRRRRALRRTSRDARRSFEVAVTFGQRRPGMRTDTSENAIRLEARRFRLDVFAETACSVFRAFALILKTTYWKLSELLS